jgi:hypothetical protein
MNELGDDAMLKRKRLLLILGSLAAVLLAGYGTLRLTAPRHHITEETFQAIQEGMTEKEVETILGAKAGVYTSRCQTGAYPVGRCGDPVVGCDLMRGCPGKEWVTEGISVYVLFDEHDRVARTHKGIGVLTGNESFLAKLRRWLGIR